MSQITKPMALDETLQDVVTAIQGITQGGMIVSTGTVGSATQPVYIDGGVPTAITSVQGRSVQDLGTSAWDDWATQGAAGVYFYRYSSSASTSTYNLPESGVNVWVHWTNNQNAVAVALKRDGQGKAWTNTLAESSWNGWTPISGKNTMRSGEQWIAYPGEPGEYVYYFVDENTTTYHLPSQYVIVTVKWYKNGDTVRGEATAFKWLYNGGYGVWKNALHSDNGQTTAWQGWKQIYGITTGTPTSANNNISLDRTEVYKSGNVVQVNVRAIVNTAFTPAESTVLVTLPYKPKAVWSQIARLSGAMDGSNSTGMCEISNTGQIIWGSAPYSQLAANTKIWFSGTYLTED